MYTWCLETAQNVQKKTNEIQLKEGKADYYATSAAQKAFVRLITVSKHGFGCV